MLSPEHIPNGPREMDERLATTLSEIVIGGHSGFPTSQDSGFGPNSLTVDTQKGYPMISWIEFYLMFAQLLVALAKALTRN